MDYLFLVSLCVIYFSFLSVATLWFIDSSCDSVTELLSYD